MHELSLTCNIVAIVSEHANGARVIEVTLEVGKLSAVAPDAIRFCFDIVTRGTVLEGARLEVIEIPGRGRCRRCGSELELSQLIERCACGSTDVEQLAGEELIVKQMVTV